MNADASIAGQGAGFRSVDAEDAEEDGIDELLAAYAYSAVNVGGQRIRPEFGAELELVPGDIERPMKDAEDVDISVVLDEVCDPVVPVEQYPHVAR